MRFDHLRDDLRRVEIRGTWTWANNVARVDQGAEPSVVVGVPGEARNEVVTTAGIIGHNPGPWPCTTLVTKHSRRPSSNVYVVENSEPGGHHLGSPTGDIDTILMDVRTENGLLLVARHPVDPKRIQ